MSLARSLAPVAVLAVAAASMPAAAVEPYAATGFPYLLVGVAQPLAPSVTVRADFGTVAHHNYSGSTSDNDFKGNVSYDRVALLGDWFAAGNGFRLTGGVTFDHAKATMRASSHNGQIVLGGVTYSAPSDLYYVESDVSAPDVMPYVGIGWGHHDKPDAKGFTFNFDLGASIGQAKGTPLKASPALASELALSQSGSTDLASENHKFQDGVASVKALPQITFGVGYRF